MPPIQTIGAYETKTHLADLLRRVRTGESFTITQRGEPVADLLPARASERRAGAQAAARMRGFMHETSKGKPCDLKSLIDEGRD